MKLRYLIVTVLFAAGAGAADDLESLVTSNTLHETRGNGTQSWYTFDKDHTFHSRDATGKSSSGTWQLSEKGEVCIAPQGAAADAPKPCLKIQARNVGDSWDREGPNGMKEHFAVEAGKQ